MLPIVEAEFWALCASNVQFLVREKVLSGKPLGSTTRVLGDRGTTQAGNPSSDRPWNLSAFAMLLLSAMVMILYRRLLGPWAKQLWDDPNYSHGLLVPVFAAYILWRERMRWRASLRPSNCGLSIMFLAIGLLVLGMLGAERFTARISLLMLISGIIVFLAGWRRLRSVAFPIGYLAFMIPLPAIIYYQLTFPLQLWASRLGAHGLVMLGVHTVREGNLLILPNCTLDVVEACSGIRSLLSLLAVVVGYLYLVEPSMWKRCLLVASTIPIAVVTNGFRLVSAGLLSSVFGPEVDSGAVHLMRGLAFSLSLFFRFY